MVPQKSISLLGDPRRLPSRAGAREAAIIHGSSSDEGSDSWMTADQPVQ